MNINLAVLIDGDNIPDPGHEDNSDPDTDMPNFFGTSAAAPHAAAGSHHLFGLVMI